METTTLPAPVAAVPEHAPDWRILIVDDSPEDREFYKRLIQERLGSECRIEEAEIGEEGFARYKASRPDCILLDYRLPDIDGLEFLREIAEPAGVPVAVIMLTGQGSRDVDLDAMAAGASDYLVKGQVSADLLERAIRYSVERKSVERELAQAAAELARSNAELEQFAYIASHDLQAPLRRIAGFLDLLSRRYGDKLDEDGQEFISFAVEGAKKMQTLINDLLQYARVGTGSQERRMTALDQILRDVMTELEPRIRKAGARITADPLPELMSNAPQLHRLLMNLITNAIKYNDKSQPAIHVSARRQGAVWVISVRDNGRGIPEDQFENVFKIFTRIRENAEIEGNGIGLAICEKIVEQHGGKIWVTSEKGAGTTFSFSLPTRRTIG